MTLGQFIDAHRDELVQRWVEKVAQRHGLEGESAPQLINDVPEFLEELIACLDEPLGRSTPGTTARAHGRQRAGTQQDVGGLSEEFSMVAETVLEMARDRGYSPSIEELVGLMRAIGRGTSASVREYARMRDRELSRASAMHFSFVAHELRTPLNSAGLAIDVLSTDPAAVTSMLPRLVRAHEQLISLIDHALTRARLDDDPYIHPEVVDVREVVKQVLENATLAARQRDIEVVSTIIPFQFEADAKLLISALTNLVMNGVKFSKPGTKVTLSGISDESQVVFRVSDHCGGVSDDIAENLFAPFVQGNKDRSGFGLGLMIVKQAVEAHDGVVRVENHDDGCTFILELPCSQPARASTPPPRPF